MSSERDYYEVLGVTRTASADEIRRAYRRLARERHPDVNKSADAETRFAELQEAYDVLSDAEKRRAYDQFGAAGVGVGQGPGGFSGGWSARHGGGPPGEERAPPLCPHDRTHDLHCRAARAARLQPCLDHVEPGNRW